MKRPSFRKKSDKNTEAKTVSGSKFGAFKLSPKTGLSGLLILSLLLFGVSGWYWYSKVFANPDRVISDMLRKGMQTNGVYRTVSQKSRQNNVDQTIYLSFSPQVATQTSSRLEDAGRVGETTSVVTETIGTKDADFVRYTSIDIPKSDKKQNFDTVLNVWGKREKNDQKGEEVSFLNEAFFSIVPFGNLPERQLDPYLSEIEKAELYKYKKAEQKIIGGRPVIVYEMELDTEKLVNVLVKYVELTGLGDAAQLDPEQYKNAPPLQTEFTVDLLSRHLSQVVFMDSGRTEKYSSYGMRRSIEPPAQTISIDELQSRLQKLQ